MEGTLADPATFRVATFNIRNVNDRYEEREPLLKSAFAAIDADIIGLQEVMFDPHDQDDVLAATLPARLYRSMRSPAERNPGFGNAILCRMGEVQVEERLRLNSLRSLQRVLVVVPGERTLWFVTTHLHHKPLEPEVREDQVRQLIAWMADAPVANATIVTGDFNMPPTENGYRLMREAGFRSALLEANGSEPAVTWPSGIQAETMDTDGDPACLDYIWLRGDVTVAKAWVDANQPAPGDATMYPSDHFALVADVVMG